MSKLNTPRIIHFTIFQIDFYVAKYFRNSPEITVLINTNPDLVLSVILTFFILMEDSFEKLLGQLQQYVYSKIFCAN